MSLYLVWLGERLGHNQDNEIMDISDNAVAQLISALVDLWKVRSNYGKNQAKIKISPIVNLGSIVSVASCKAETLVPYGVVSRLIKSSWNVCMYGYIQYSISEVHPNTTNT